MTRMYFLNYLLCAIICLICFGILVLAYVHSMAEFEDRKAEPEVSFRHSEAAEQEREPALSVTVNPALRQAGTQPRPTESFL